MLISLKGKWRAKKTLKNTYGNVRQDGGGQQFAGLVHGRLFGAAEEALLAHFITHVPAQAPIQTIKNLAQPGKTQ